MEGGRPYVDFVEKKPPLIYVLFAAGMSLVGRHDLPALRLLLILVSAADGAVRVTDRPAPLRRATRSRGAPTLRRRDLGRSAAGHARGQRRVAVSASPRARDLVGARRASGTLARRGRGHRLRLRSSSSRRECSFPIMAAFLAWQNRGRTRWQAPAALGAGFLAIWLATAAVLRAVGSWDEFIDWTLTVNRYYINNGNSLGDAIGLLVRALLVLVTASPALWLFGIGGLSARSAAAHKRGTRAHVAVVCGSRVPLSLGGRFFPHYFLQLFPPLVLLASNAAVALWDRTARWPWTRATVAAAVSSVLLVWPAVHWTRAGQDVERVSTPHAVPSARRLAAYIRQETAPDARILVWGYGSAIYFLSERRPATRFPYVTYLVGAVEATPSWWNPFQPSEPLQIPRAWDSLSEDLAKHPSGTGASTPRPRTTSPSGNSPPPATHASRATSIAATIAPRSQDFRCGDVACSEERPCVAQCTRVRQRQRRRNRHARPQKLLSCAAARRFRCPHLGSWRVGSVACMSWDSRSRRLWPSPRLGARPCVKGPPPAAPTRRWISR